MPFDLAERVPVDLEIRLILGPHQHAILEVVETHRLVRALPSQVQAPTDLVGQVVKAASIIIIIVVVVMAIIMAAIVTIITAKTCLADIYIHTGNSALCAVVHSASCNRRMIHYLRLVQLWRLGMFMAARIKPALLKSSQICCFVLRTGRYIACLRV